LTQPQKEKAANLYKKARKLRADFASEFENVGLTAKLLGTKRGTMSGRLPLRTCSTR
jgi:hypothetical protein